MSEAVKFHFEINVTDTKVIEDIRDGRMIIFTTSKDTTDDEVEELNQKYSHLKWTFMKALK